MKLIIAGGRDFEDKAVATKAFIDFSVEVNAKTLHKVNPFTEIVSGGAKGADRCGEFIAQFFSLPVKQFIPDWDGLGKRAGFVRNTEMAEYADALLAFWDKKSKGTAHMIQTAKQKGLKVKVVNY
jgi:glycerophosphoryl diester phosphodiesterase